MTFIRAIPSWAIALDSLVMGMELRLLRIAWVERDTISFALELFHKLGELKDINAVPAGKDLPSWTLSTIKPPIGA